jgi:hypothetical protein
MGGAVRVYNLTPGEFGTPGQLSLGSLEMGQYLGGGGSFNVVIAGSQPGAGGYSQVQVAGAVNLANANLQVTLSPSFVPTEGETYVLINKTGSGPVTGTFGNYGESAVIRLNIGL